MTAPTHAPKPLAFFGATGDCAGHCLALCLKANYPCNALARTPQKLITSLLAKGVPQSTIDANLTIIQGDVKNLQNVKQTLQHQGPCTSAGTVGTDTIISGIGSTPALQWSLFEPVTLTDRTICQDAGATILKAAAELAQTAGNAGTKPFFINISTTGIPAPGAKWDVPWALTWLYKWILHVPHQDKAVLEELLRKEVGREGGGGIRGYVNVKPSLLVDGEGRGVGSVRVGTEGSPAVGWMVQRKDVGGFMFAKLVVDQERVLGEGWVGGGLTVTY